MVWLSVANLPHSPSQTITKRVVARDTRNSVHYLLTSFPSSAIINTWQTNSSLSFLLASSLVITTPTMLHNASTLVSLTNYANTSNWLLSPTACRCIASWVYPTHAWCWANWRWLHIRWASRLSQRYDSFWAYYWDWYRRWESIVWVYVRLLLMFTSSFYGWM